MVLTKGDQKYIADTVNGAVDNLARIVAKGFEQTATKDDVAKLNFKIIEIEARIAEIERDIKEIRKSLISRMEIEDIMARLLLLEKKIGIKSGK